MQSSHNIYMQRCLQLARLGEYYVAPNPMVGAVLVLHADEGDQIIGEGWHQQYGQPHAEPNCIRQAETIHGEDIDYNQCTLYVSLEPCSHYGKTPPCAELIIKKGIQQVVVGCLDPNPQVAGRGVRMMREAGIDVIVGVLEEECRELNKRFICLQEKKRPYVVLKWAQTADGYIDAKRELNANPSSPLTISTAITKQLVHQQRAENMAIMVGTRTALLDDPRLLTTRWSGRNAIRITLDRHGVLPKDSRLFSDEAPTIVYTECTDWQYILNDLAARNIHSVLVEGGTCLLEHIMKTGIYDELHVEVSRFSLKELAGDVCGVKAPDYTLSTQPQIVDGNWVYVEKRGH